MVNGSFEGRWYLVCVNWTSPDLLWCPLKKVDTEFQVFVVSFPFCLRDLYSAYGDGSGSALLRPGASLPEGTGPSVSRSFVVLWSGLDGHVRPSTQHCERRKHL